MEVTEKVGEGWRKGEITHINIRLKLKSFIMHNGNF